MAFNAGSQHSIELRHEKYGLWGFRPGPTQTSLYSHRKRLDTPNFGFKKKRNCTIYVAKTKVLISFAVTTKLICTFVFALTKIWFSHDTAHIIFGTQSFSPQQSFATEIQIAKHGQLTNIPYISFAAFQPASQPGYPPSSQPQPSQSGFGQQPPTSQYGGYQPTSQAGPQGQMYPQPGQYNPQMGAGTQV